ncbi:hypothetical protein UY3_09555 [Chelonia mydas]|uniref:Uncharacterized protein n=1 Tax=Chelonia mydas TaxID=8469 RepID=M7BCP5_CHEMY|nr:hypothetical protein UY3_09555 [Chelonia mydas]
MAHQGNPLAGRNGLFTCSVRGFMCCNQPDQHIPQPTPLPAAPIGLKRRTAASGSCDQPNPRTLQRPQTQLIAASTGRSSPFQANGGCGKRQPANPSAHATSHSPTGLGQQTKTSDSCDRPNLQMLQRSTKDDIFSNYVGLAPFHHGNPSREQSQGQHCHPRAIGSCDEAGDFKRYSLPLADPPRSPWISKITLESEPESSLGMGNNPHSEAEAPSPAARFTSPATAELRAAAQVQSLPQGPSVCPGKEAGSSPGSERTELPTREQPPWKRLGTDLLLPRLESELLVNALPIRHGTPSPPTSPKAPGLQTPPQHYNWKSSAGNCQTTPATLLGIGDPPDLASLFI